MDLSRKLFAIKLFHTLVWAFFAGCILAVPVAVYLGNMRMAGLLIGVVFVEVLVILFNRGTCPLTPMAARYTTNRAPNFDIFLPPLLAKYNKVIFGSLFALGLLYAGVTWLTNQSAA